MPREKKTGYVKGGHALTVRTSPERVWERREERDGLKPMAASDLLSPPRPKGLKNVGNTCYANAVLQCLLSTALTHALIDPRARRIFRAYSFNLQILRKGSGSVNSADGDDLEEEDNILRLKERKQSREARRIKESNDEKLRDRCFWIANELKTITLDFQADVPMETPSISDLFLGQKPKASIVDPGAITRRPDLLCPSLRPYQQEDAHEFLRALLSTLAMNGRNRELSSLFDGLLESSVTCLTCGRPSLTRDRYMDLSLDIGSPKIETLEDALEEFTKTETLSGENKVHCVKCKTKRTATKGLRLATAPSILVCHLKRFAFDKNGGLVRLSKKVNFPLELDMENYMSNLNRGRPPPYELVAVLVHQGKSCEWGHYIAYVKNHGQWYCCNDSTVTAVSLEKVLSQQAYILMYEVAEMRKKHGFPSPSGPDLRKADPKSGLEMLMSTVLCGMDDSALRDVCFQKGQTKVYKRKKNSKRSKKAAHDAIISSRSDDFSALGDSLTVHSKEPIEPPSCKKSVLRRATSSNAISRSDVRAHHLSLIERGSSAPRRRRSVIEQTRDRSETDSSASTETAKKKRNSVRPGDLPPRRR
jgi:hypothetical protein